MPIKNFSKEIRDGVLVYSETGEPVFDREKKVCCICCGDFTGLGNNPEPFEGDRACDDCNDRFVTPVRMCLGRGYSDQNVLLLIQTIAELGKLFKSITTESLQKAMAGNGQRPNNGHHS